jgi:hypothetical protein
MAGDNKDTTDEDLQEMKSLVFKKCRSLSATFGVEDEFPTDDVPSFEELHENLEITEQDLHRIFRTFH